MIVIQIGTECNFCKTYLELEGMTVTLILCLKVNFIIAVRQDNSCTFKIKLQALGLIKS